MENWKAVPQFAGLYEVSDAGHVRRVGSASALNPYLRGSYPCVSLKDGKRRQMKSVHLLVLEAFVGPRPLNHEGAHLDGNPMNAALANLAWASKAENERHKRAHGTAKVGERSHFAKLTNEQAEIVREIAAAGIPQVKVARLLGISETSISRIVLGRAFV